MTFSVQAPRFFFFNYRLRYGKSAATGVGRRWKRGPGSTRTSPREEGMGSELRQTEDDTAILIAESDWTLTLFAIRLSQYAIVLLSTHRSVQEGTRCSSTSEIVHENDDARCIYRAQNLSRELLASFYPVLLLLFARKLCGNN